MIALLSKAQYNMKCEQRFTRFRMEINSRFMSPSLSRLNGRLSSTLIKS